jgi:L-threonylcarbamoyladenylate synthase
MRVGWLTFAGAELAHLPGLTRIMMPSDVTAYAAELYAALHSLDKAGVERIIVSMPPDTEEWLAVCDRLRRASSAPI